MVALSRAGLAELAADVAAGMMRPRGVGARRPRVIRCEFPDAPAVGMGNPLSVVTRRAGRVWLRVRQDGCGVLNEGEIAPNGDVSITPLNAGILRVALTLECDRPSAVPIRTSYECAFQPKVEGPSFAQIEVPKRVRIGQELHIIWDAPAATAVTVHIDDGAKHDERTVAPAGVINLRPTRPGPIILRFIAQGKYGQSAKTRSVTVISSKPFIELERPVQYGLPGTAVTFSWCISNAREAYLEAPERHERHPVALSGGLSATIERTTEQLRLIAIGFDGCRRIARMSAAPSPLELLR